MESKFKFISVLFVPGLLILMLVLLIKMILEFEATFTSTESGSLVLIFVTLALFALITDLYQNATQLTYLDDNIVVRRFLGLLPAKSYKYEELEGFHTSKMSSRSGTFNYLYLMKGGTKIARVSNFYHSNYSFMLSEAEEKLQDLGNVYTNLFTLISDTFKK